MNKKKQKNNRKIFEEQKKSKSFFIIPEEIKKLIWGILFFLIAIIAGLSFFDLAGIAGRKLTAFFKFFIGNTVFITPLVFILIGFVFLRTRYRKFLLPLILASFFLSVGLAGIFGALAVEGGKSIIEIKSRGGLLGYLFGSSLFKLFGFWVTQIIFGTLVFIGAIIFRQLLKREKPRRLEVIPVNEEAQPSLIKKIFTPRFKVKEIEPALPQKPEKAETPAVPFQMKTKSLENAFGAQAGYYKLPPLDLLEIDRENPSSGDTKLNSAIIKKTLLNFDIPVEMGEINIGPTVTQYTLKPAEGIKLSKITALVNDLSLALAAHPIRIEAPIPGRSLVGIEIPNRVRARVRLRNLLEHPNYQNSPANLLVALGRDVSGLPVYADLSRMPHLLVAGSTGTGKTIFLNSLILSLLYKNSPELLRLILIDPKKVEFFVYRDLPHLLAPIITEAVSACNALKWLIGEMERRFNVLAKVKARDIGGYNELISEKQKLFKNNQLTKEKGETKEAEFEEEAKLLPYIVLVVDELADLMAARGRDMEAGIVRLAQMARAVGIHLVLATQRPSVEVITGLIKANITSRVTFQVASQVDSRTVLDSAGAEKLLGLGDMLFVSAEVSKPRRVQGAYASEKEVRKVVDFVRTQTPELEESEVEEEIAGLPEAEPLPAPANLLAPPTSLKKALEVPATDLGEITLNNQEDPLYEEAKRVVIEAKKASASLLQRRLRLGYARAARLIDMLEERGVVGPGEGAKPREVYLSDNRATINEIVPEEETPEESVKEGEEEEWKRV